MAKFTWQDGTLVSKAKVEIGGTIYEVDPEEYSGATPLSASNLNAMQDGIYEDIENLQGKILWTNPNPATNFSGQTITLSSSNYDVLEIFYYDYRSNARMLSTKIKKGENGNLCSVFLTGSEVYMSTREMTYISDTSYSFNNCTSITNANITVLNSSPAQCIPVYIVGYKTGLFN